jgi:two-component system cell cycle response regulator CtrA
MARSVTLALRCDEICVDVAEGGEDALNLVRHLDYDAVVTEMELADMKGADFIRKLRASLIQTPVLVLSRCGLVESKVAALKAGADDYMIKPFHQAELVGRVRALVRRSRGYANSAIAIGAVTLNLSARTVEVNGNRVHLTDMEYQILELLSLRRGSTIARETFINHLYGDGEGPESKTIELFVCKLRKKLAAATGGQNFIETVRERGYLLPVAQAA